MRFFIPALCLVLAVSCGGGPVPREIPEPLAVTTREDPGEDAVPESGLAAPLETREEDESPAVEYPEAVFPLPLPETQDEQLLIVAEAVPDLPETHIPLAGPLISPIPESDLPVPQAGTPDLTQIVPEPFPVDFVVELVVPEILAPFPETVAPIPLLALARPEEPVRLIEPARPAELPLLPPILLPAPEPEVFLALEPAPVNPPPKTDPPSITNPVPPAHRAEPSPKNNTALTPIPERRIAIAEPPQVRELLAPIQQPAAQEPSPVRESSARQIAQTRELSAQQSQVQESLVHQSPPLIREPPQAQESAPIQQPLVHQEPPLPLIRESPVHQIAQAQEFPTQQPLVQEPPVQSVQEIQEEPAAEVLAQEDGAVIRALSPEDYLRRAREEYNAGRIESGLSIMKDFVELYPAGTDEAWLLYGQLLEANSSFRDIRLALEYYRRVVGEFPQSSRIPEAQRRIAYLGRFYFTIQ